MSEEYGLYVPDPSDDRRPRTGSMDQVLQAMTQHAAPERIAPVPKPNMVIRSLRVPETLWTAAKEKADERGENISDVIRDALERYVKKKSKSSSSERHSQ